MNNTASVPVLTELAFLIYFPFQVTPDSWVSCRNCHYILIYFGSSIFTVKLPYVSLRHQEYSSLCITFKKNKTPQKNACQI